MKISKVLLATIAVAVTATVISSCSKDSIEPNKEQQIEERNIPLDPCPACGMG